MPQGLTPDACQATGQSPHILEVAHCQFLVKSIPLYHTRGSTPIVSTVFHSQAPTPTPAQLVQVLPGPQILLSYFDSLGRQRRPVRFIGISPDSMHHTGADMCAWPRDRPIRTSDFGVIFSPHVLWIGGVCRNEESLSTVTVKNTTRRPTMQAAEWRPQGV